MFEGYSTKFNYAPDEVLNLYLKIVAAHADKGPNRVSIAFIVDNENNRTYWELSDTENPSYVDYTLTYHENNKWHVSDYGGQHVIEQGTVENYIDNLIS